jgi:hypothetical protein
MRPLAFLLLLVLFASVLGSTGEQSSALLKFQLPFSTFLQLSWRTLSG